MTVFWIIIILLGLVLTLYNAYVIWKISKAIFWILTHVMVLPPGRKDTEYDRIRRTFGIEAISEATDDTFDDLVDSDVTDIDGKE